MKALYLSQLHCSQQQTRHRTCPSSSSLTCLLKDQTTWHFIFRNYKEYFFCKSQKLLLHKPRSCPVIPSYLYLCCNLFPSFPQSSRLLAQVKNIWLRHLIGIKFWFFFLVHRGQEAVTKPGFNPLDVFWLNLLLSTCPPAIKTPLPISESSNQWGDGVIPSITHSFSVPPTFILGFITWIWILDYFQSYWFCEISGIYTVSSCSPDAWDIWSNSTIRKKIALL